MMDINLIHDAAGIVGKWDTWERHHGNDFDYLMVPDPTDPEARVAWNPLRFESDAFMIVKALIARGLQFRLYGPYSDPITNMSAPDWVAVFYDQSPTALSFIGLNSEPARAITIACLKAVGGQHGMKQWEYCYINLKGKDSDGFRRHLRMAGEACWELCGFDYGCAWLKRPWAKFEHLVGEEPIIEEYKP